MDRHERPHREEAGIYAQSRAEGRVPRTEGEVEALIRAHAADLAATKGVRPHTPPFLEELVATFWHRLFRDNRPRQSDLAASMESQRVARVKQSVAEERVSRFTQRVRNLSSERKRMERPATGVTLTRPEALLLCVIPAFVIEVFGSAPSLDAAFKLGKYPSWLFAAAISGILILAAEQLGNTLASAASTSRRRAKWTAGVLLAIAIAAGVVAVISLANSRSTNLAYQQAGHLNISAANSNGSFGSGVETKKPEAKGAFGAASPTIADAPSSPDYSFFIPLSILVMATAMLFAYRIELAHDWNELARAIEETEGDVDDAREEREAAFEAERLAMTPEGEVVVETAADVEREHGLLTLWIARFMAEYHRLCAALETEPQSLSSPPVPTPAEALLRMIDPQGESRMSRDAGSGAPPPNDDGDGPAGPTPESETPPPPPPTQPAGGNNRDRRSDRQGRPRRFGGSGD